MGGFLSRLLSSSWWENQESGTDKNERPKDTSICKQRTTPSIRVIILEERPGGVIQNQVIIDVDTEDRVVLLKRQIAEIFHEVEENVSFFYQARRLNDKETLTVQGVPSDAVIHYRNERLEYDD